MSPPWTGTGPSPIPMRFVSWSSTTLCILERKRIGMQRRVAIRERNDMERHFIMSIFLLYTHEVYYIFCPFYYMFYAKRWMRSFLSLKQMCQVKMSWNSVFWVFLKVDVESVVLDCLGTRNDATVTSCSLRDLNYQEQHHFRLPPTLLYGNVTYRYAYVSTAGERNASSFLSFLGIDVWFHWFNNVFLCIFGHNG